MTGWISQCLKKKKEGPALNNRLVRRCRKSSECVPLEILSSHQSKKRKHRDGQVDRQVYIASEALKGCLDGHVTVVRHERRSKTKPVSR